MERATIEDANLTYRTGAVFYRDVTDDYLTRVSDLNVNKDITTEFISNQKKLKKLFLVHGEIDRQNKFKDYLKVGAPLLLLFLVIILFLVPIIWPF